MGAYVGRTAVKDGKGVMVDWRYADGKDYLPSDDAVRKATAAGELIARAARRVPRAPRVSLASLLVQLLNGLAGASALFLVAAGLTLIFGVTRVVNFAHGSLYMLGAYLALVDRRVARAAGHCGFWGGVVAGGARGRARSAR